jgi:hypothetical protein
MWLRDADDPEPALGDRREVFAGRALAGARSERAGDDALERREERLPDPAVVDEDAQGSLDPEPSGARRKLLRGRLAGDGRA